MKKYCLVIFLMLFGPLFSVAFATVPPTLMVPAGLSLAEVKITGNEFIMLYNNSGTTITNLSNYWIYAYNNNDPTATGVSSSSQQLPAASLGDGQTVLLTANGGSTCGAAITDQLSISLTDSSGYLAIVRQSFVNGVLTSTVGDSVSWTSSSSVSAGAQIITPTSSSAKAAFANYRFLESTSPAIFWWQPASQDSSNTCQLNVTISGVTSPGPSNPGNQLLLGSPPAAIFITDGTTTASNGLPAADIGLSAPVINEILPNPAEPQSDDEDEFVELYNSNNVAFDLTGFRLQVGTATLHNYSFPADTTLMPQSFTTFYSIDTGLSMSNNGGQVTLLDPSDDVISQTDIYGTAKDGQAWALADGKWYWTTQPTPGATNVVKQPVTAKPYTLPSSTKTTKSSKTMPAAQSTAGSSSGTAGLTNPATNPPGLHPLVLATVGALAVGYAAYEYRNDLANRLYQFRRYREARRATRYKTQTAGNAGIIGRSRGWQNHLGAWLSTRLW